MLSIFIPPHYIHMKLKITLCTLVFAYLFYVSYLDYKGEHMPSELVDIFSHPILRLLILAGVAALGYFRHMECAIILAIAYLISVTMANREGAREAFTEYLTMQDGEAVTQSEIRDEEDGIQEVGTGVTGMGSSVFNPQAYRANETVLSSGIPDPLAPSGDNFLSDPSGPYADSGVAYQMNMA